MSALRLLRDATASQSSARLDLATLSSPRRTLASRAIAAASARVLQLEAIDITERASLANDPGYDPRPVRLAIICLLFFLSGATALCYQVAWTRHLVLVFGNTTHAVALILGAYMLGLALGSEAGGRLADRSRRPIRLYAAFEAGIGAYAFAFPLLLTVARSAYLGLGTGAAPILFVGSFVLLLVPTFLMGTTLPLLVRGTVDRAQRTGRTVGLLYGVNTLGAVTGAAGAGFWLMEAAGVLGSTYVAGAVNVGVGLAALVLLREVRSTAPTVREAAPAVAVSANPRIARAALVAAFAGGLVGLAAEVVWTRLLVFFLQGFTYTFSAMLATFLLGLAIGGLLFGWIASRTQRPVVVLGRLQIGVGVLGAAVLLALANHREVTLAIWDWAKDHPLVTGAAPENRLRVHHCITLVVASAAILLPPAILMGGGFPLAAMAFQRGLGDLGARIGRLYAVNTLGAVLGSLVAGFVLAPLLGMTWAAVAVASAALVAGVAVLWIGGERGAGTWIWSGAGAAALVALVGAAEPDKPFLLRSHAFAGANARENELLTTREGVVCQVSVVENRRENYRLLYTDEFQAAGTKPEYRYMRMLAHLPVALARDPEQVLVICWGTGTTAGSVGTHGAVKELDIVEISPEVMEVASYFAHVNRGVLEGAGRDDLAVRVHVDDGRNFVLRADEQWGVISLEPLMPYTPAAIHFYTEDFYRECAPRLAEGGLMCQWIPLQGMSGDHFRRLVAAFVAVFPDSGMFFVDGAVALVGGNEPLELDYARVASRLADAAVREDLDEVGYGDPVRALATFVAGGEALRAFVKDVEPVTDEYPVLEFHPIPLGAGVAHLAENLAHMRDLRVGIDELPVVLDAADVEIRERLLRAHRAAQHLYEGNVNFEFGTFLNRHGRADAVDHLRRALEEYERAHDIDPESESVRRAYEGMRRYWLLLEANQALEQGELETARARLARAAPLRALRRADEVPTQLAGVLNRLERFEEALEAACRATALFPRSLVGRAERAYARAALDDMHGAAADYRRALEGAPTSELPTRLQADADRVLAASTSMGDARPLPEAIEEALGGAGRARIPPRLVLAILAADDAERFRAFFEADLDRLGSADGDDATLLRKLERVDMASPPGTADAVRALLEARGPGPEVLDRAAETLARRDVRQLAEVLDASDDPRVLAAAAGAARLLGDAGYVGTPLLRLMLHEDEAVRTRSHRSFFALRPDAPGIARLDPSNGSDPAYRNAVFDLRAWWARNR